MASIFLAAVAPSACRGGISPTKDNAFRLSTTLHYFREKKLIPFYTKNFFQNIHYNLPWGMNKHGGRIDRGAPREML
jgi:hypothetical protein